MRVLIYGATGFTGKLVSAELARRGADLILSGRDASKLDALEAPGERRPASIDDPASLARALEGADVVANCAGPFVRTGAPVLEAAIEAGVHYLDTTGEQHWMRHAFAALDGPARAAGVAALPGMGFDYLPGDLLCHLVGAPAEPLEELALAYHVENFGMTRGTMRSALEMVGGGDVTYEDGDWRPAGTGPLRAHFTFPEPLGRKRVGKYAGGEILTVPRHVKTRAVRSRITIDAVAPGPAGAIVPLLLPGAALAARTPLKKVAHDAIGRLPEGPPEDERDKVRWTIAAVAKGEDGSVRSGTVSGGDIYGLTALTIAEGAERLLGTERAGVLAPAEAYPDARGFLDALPVEVEI